MLSGLDKMDLPADWRDLPRLAAAAPTMTGGRAGPDQYVNIPAGPVPYAAIETLFSFEDVLRAKRLSGRDLREWLERAAAIYSMLDGQGGIPFLLQSEMPGFCFDMIRGLSVRIDPTRQARYDASGNCVAPNAGRVVDVRWNNAPLRDEDMFVLAMNSFRFEGGGGFPNVGTALPDHVHGPQIRSLLHDLCRSKPNLRPQPLDWQLEPGLGCDVLFDTSPQALDLLDELACFAPEVVSVTAEGFLQLRLSL